MKKRWMVSLMAVAMAVSMAACGKSSGGGTENARRIIIQINNKHYA